MGALTRSRARMPCMLCRRPLRPGACMRLRRAVRLRRGRRRGRSGCRQARCAAPRSRPRGRRCGRPGAAGRLAAVRRWSSPFCLRSVKKPGHIAAFPASRDGPPGAFVPPPQGDRDWRAGGPLAAAELLVDGEHPLGGHGAEQGDGRGEADLRRVGQDLADTVAPVFRWLHLEDRVFRKHVGAAVGQLRLGDAAELGGEIVPEAVLEELAACRSRWPAGDPAAVREDDCFTVVAAGGLGCHAHRARQFGGVVRVRRPRSSRGWCARYYTITVPGGRVAFAVTSRISGHGRYVTACLTGCCCRTAGKGPGRLRSSRSGSLEPSSRSASYAGSLRSARAAARAASISGLSGLVAPALFRMEI